MIKSKEEMIKFCMRKAFKFIYDRIANKSKLTKKEQKTLKNQYFGLESNAEYALPFRYLKASCIYNNTKCSFFS